MQAKKESLSVRTLVRVYWNIRLGMFSIQTEQGRNRWIVEQHVSTVLLDQCSFLVNEAGRQRVIKTGHKNVHAKVQGYLAHVVPGMIPLDIWHTPEFCLREVMYNPYQAATFVRRDKRDEAVFTADSVLLSSSEVSGTVRPSIKAWRQDMWGEFTQEQFRLYMDLVDEVNTSYMVKPGDPRRPDIDRLVEAGLLVLAFTSGEQHFYTLT